MKIWTYAEARDKLNLDLDLQDQSFITPNELIGYFNEGIKYCEAEILKMDEDYFLSYYYVPLVSGTASYTLPNDIFGQKIRGVEYSSGNIIYPVKRYRRRDKFDKIAFDTQYQTSSQSQWYRYYLTNRKQDGVKFNLVPTPAETATVPPQLSPVTPMTMHYIRHANRVPLLAEYIVDYEQFLPTAVDVTLNTIVVAPHTAYATGDLIKVTTSATLPAPLVAGTVYYAIAASATSLKLATSLSNARAGTAIDLTTQGTGYHTISVSASQNIVDNTEIDIPEFIESVIEFAKWRSYNKEGDPRSEGSQQWFEGWRKQMIDTLSNREPDDDDTIEADFSHYEDMS